jgi:hypothetical protein
MNRKSPFGSPQSRRFPVRGLVLAGLLLLTVPGLLGSSDPGVASSAGGVLIIAVPVGFLWLLSRGLHNLLGRRR